MSHWPLGKKLDIYPSSNRLVCSVKIKTPSGELIHRSVCQVCVCWGEGGGQKNILFFECVNPVDKLPLFFYCGDNQS